MQCNCEAKIKLNGKLYSNLSLSGDGTDLPFNLNSCGWGLSSDRNNIQLTQQSIRVDGKDDKVNKVTWNNFILNKILPTVYIESMKYLVEMIDAIDHEDQVQIISKYWPMAKRNEYIPFGKEVLKLICENDERIFWSELDNGKFVRFSEAHIGDDSKVGEVVINYLLDNGIKVVILDDEKTKIFDDLEIEHKKIDTKLVRDILREYRFTNNDLEYSSKINLLKYILADEKYNDLDGVPLVPLFDDSFGTFGEGYFSLTTDEQIKLFPKGSIGNLI